MKKIYGNNLREALADALVDDEVSPDYIVPLSSVEEEELQSEINNPDFYYSKK